MKQLKNKKHIEAVIRLQERLELLKGKNAREETVTCNTNLTIALLWDMTQEGKNGMGAVHRNNAQRK